MARPAHGGHGRLGYSLFGFRPVGSGGAVQKAITETLGRVERHKKNVGARLRQLGIPISENLGKQAAGQLIGLAARASETAH